METFVEELLNNFFYKVVLKFVFLDLSLHKYI